MQLSLRTTALEENDKKKKNLYIYIYELGVSLGHISTEYESSKNRTCSIMFIAKLFTIGRTLKQCIYTIELRRCGISHHGVLYSLKKGQHAIMSNKMEGIERIMLSKVSQSNKKKHWTFT